LDIAVSVTSPCPSQQISESDAPSGSCVPRMRPRRHLTRSALNTIDTASHASADRTLHYGPAPRSLMSRLGLPATGPGMSGAADRGRDGIYDRYEYLVEKCLVVAGFSMRS
jgi:hypothetical protein